jgi:hypothetical protein
LNFNSHRILTPQLKLSYSWINCTTLAYQKVNCNARSSRKESVNDEKSRRRRRGQGIKRRTAASKYRRSDEPNSVVHTFGDTSSLLLSKHLVKYSFSRLQRRVEKIQIIRLSYVGLRNTPTWGSCARRSERSHLAQRFKTSSLLNFPSYAYYRAKL